LVIICPECSASCNSEAVFCSTCGIQLVSPPAPRELTQRYEDLHRNVGDLSRRNEVLEERLRRTTEEIKNLTEQLKAEGQAHRTDVEGERSQRRVLEDRLQRTMLEMRTLTAQVRETEQARRREMLQVAQLTEANNRLLQEVKRFTRKPRYCDRCGGPLVATATPNVDLCPVCDSHWYAVPQPYAYPIAQPGPEWETVIAPESEGDYTHPSAMHAGRAWHGIFIHENCSFCGQQLQLTTDPNVLYCPYCEKYQQHTHK
jgi:NADH pyrophosphatase NudC (nudix superfamily)